MYNNLMLMLLQAQDTIKYVYPQVQNVATQSPDLLSIMGLLLGSGSVLYIVVQSILKQREKKIDSELDGRKKTVESKIEQDRELLKHETALDTEKFQFEKLKDLKRQEDNEKFQKEIINEIFGKYVKQNDWITSIYEKRFEELINLLTELKREVKDMRILSDKMNMQIKNVDDKVIKNTNIIIAKTDALLKVFANVSFSCVKDTLKTLPSENRKTLQRESEDIKISQE